MSTYTQDITHLINKIDTNIPDNDTQYITAARIRDAMGAVAYNYDLYVLKTDLDTAGYVTASALSGYATQEDLQTGMQSVLDDSYAYVVEKIKEIPGVDLSAYVTKTELSAAGYLTAVPSEYVTDTELSGMGYITSSDLPDMSAYVSQDDLQSALEPYVTESQLQEAGYATKTYVADYVATHSGPIDLSAYVTKDELSAAGYLTAVPSEYVTESQLQSTLTAYITDTELSNVLSTASYVTSNELSNAGYVTQSQLTQASYITNSDLSQASYVTTTSLQSTLESYVTQQALSAMGYITSSALSGLATETYVADYVAEHAPMPDLSAYVSKTELSQAGYITSSDLIDELGDYPTNNDLALTLQDYVSYSQFNTYTSDFVVDNDLEDLVSKDELSQAGYLTSIPSDYATYDAISQMGYITLNDIPVVDLSSYVTKTELSNAGYVTNTTLQSQLQQAGYLTSIPNNYATYDAISQMGYITSIPSDYVTESELSSMGYITSSDIPAIPVIDESIIPNTTLTYTLGDSSHFYANTYTSDVWLSAKNKFSNRSDYQVNLQLNNAWRYSFHSNGFSPANNNTQRLGQLDSQWSYTYSANFIEDGTNIKDIYATKVELPKIDESIIPNTTATYTLGDSSHLYDATYVSNIKFTGNGSSSISVINYKTLRLATDDMGFYLEKSGFRPGLNGNKLLGTSSFQWGYTYSANFFENGTNIKDIYATKVELPKIDESIIPNTTATYTLGDSSHLYNSTYTSELYVNSSSKVYNENGGVGVKIGNNSAFRFGASALYPVVNKSKTLGSSSNQWTCTYSANFIEDGTNIKDIYTQAYVLTQNQYDGLSQADKDKETIYIISDQQAYMNNELVTETSLDSRGFLTAANFNYDPTTGTLTLNL